jgi:cyclohexadieny/prephenate dehydrogenase
MSQTMFETVSILGLGLIGSSLAHGLREKGLAGRVIGYDASADVRGRAAGLKLCDEIAETPDAAVADADLVILSMPVGAAGDAACSIAEALKPGAIVTDVGGVKSAVIAKVEAALPEGVAFVPGHPIAGTEHSGPEAGFGTLFEGRWAILTPSERTTDEALEKISALWRALGSDVEIMTPEHHDLVLATTSHLPHLIAFNIVGTAADMEEVTRSEVIKFSAGGIGSGDVEGYLPQQQGGGAGDAGPVLRGSGGAAADDPVGRWGGAAGPLHPHAGDPPGHHRGGSGDGSARFRPARCRRCEKRAEERDLKAARETAAPFRF